MPEIAIAPEVKSSREAEPTRTVKEYFYTFMSLLIVAIILYGFSHTTDQNLIHAAVPRPALLWVHGILFSGWLVFFVLQSLLVRVRAIWLHRMLGWFGAAMGIGVVVVGVETTIVMARFHHFVLHQGDVSFLIVPFWDITCFAVAFGLCVYWRRKPDYHRRLALIATCALTAAGFGRFPFLPAGVFYPGVDVLVFLGMARDVVADRRVHIVYRYALPILVICQAAVMLIVITKPTFWVRIAWAIAS